MLNTHAAAIGPAYGGFQGNVGDLVSLLLTGSLTVAGVIVLFLLVFSGLHIIMSAGNGDTKGAAQGKDALKWAIIGFILILFAFFIIRILEEMIGVRFFTFPTFEAPCSPVPGNPC